MFGINESLMNKLKMMEIFDDGDFKAYLYQISKGMLQTEDQEREMYKFEDMKGQTPLHLVCFNGYDDFAVHLIKRYRQLDLDTHVKDKKGNTPLNLVCSHGYSSPGEKDDYGDFLRRRYTITKELVTSRKELKKSVQRKRNNPMHWALYYGDIESGLYIFRKYPFILLKKNESGKTALEIAFEKVINKSNKKQSKKLIKSVLEKFIFYLFKGVGVRPTEDAEEGEAGEEGEGDQNEDEIKNLGNLQFLEERDIRKIRIIREKMKTEGMIYDQERLLEKFNQEKQMNKIRSVFQGFKIGDFGKDDNVDMDQPQAMEPDKNSDVFTAFTNFPERIEEENAEEEGDEDEGAEEEGAEEDEAGEEGAEEDGEYTGGVEKDQFISKGYEETMNPRTEENAEEFLTDMSEDKDKTISEDSLSINSKDIEKETDKESINESDEDNKQDKIHFEMLIDQNNQTLTILDPSKTNIKRDKYLLLLHRLLILAVYIKDLKVIKVLIDNFGVNPFFSCVRGKSALQMAAHKGRPIIMKYFLSRSYSYIGSEKKIDILKMIEIPDKKELNTPLHLAVSEGDTEIVDQLLALGAKLDPYNYKNWQPFDMNMKIKMLKRAKKKYKEIEKEYIDSLNCYFDPEFYDEEAWEMVTEDYEYLIVARDLSPDPKKTILYKQLHRIQKRWNKQIKVKSFIPVDHQVKNYYRYYYIIKMKRACRQRMADFLNLKLFNHEHGFVTTFLNEDARHFEPLRAFDVHKILLFILNEEFPMQYYIKKTIIEDHFPLHLFNKRLKIRNLWNNEKYKTLFINLSPKVPAKALMPYNSIAFYYGCDIAMYLAFNSIYTSYLMLLSIIGIIFYIFIFTISGIKGLKDPFNNFLVPSYVLFVSIWVTVAYEKWTQREQELAFVWNTMNFKEKIQTLPEYEGIYVIDEVTKQVVLEDQFPTRFRKIITNIPLLILGVSLIFVNFIIFTFVNDEINTQAATFNPTWLKSFYQILSGVANGAIIFIFSLIYNFISIKAVDWENHRLWNTKQNSLVIKTFVFDFTLAYINLFYYAFVEKNFGLLANNFISMMITKNVLFNVKINLVPYFIYLIKKRIFMAKWHKRRSQLKTNLLKTQNLMKYVIKDSSVKKKKKKKAKKQFKKLDLETQRGLLKLEKKLILQEQIERTMIMSKHPDLRLIWTNYAIQFGYISFFSLVFPLAPLIGCLLNIFDLMFSYFALTDHIQRKKCIEQGSIGIWAHIFMLMSFVSLFSNLGIMIFADAGVEDLLRRFKVPEDYIGDKFIIIYLAIAEHIIFLIKFLLSIAIVGMPRWIREEISDRNNKQELHNEAVKRELLQIRNKKKIHKKLKQLDIDLFSHIHGNIIKGPPIDFKEDLDN